MSAIAVDYNCETLMQNRESTTKLSKTEALILGMLIKGAEMYGLEIVHASGGRIARGSIYVLLDRMHDKGLVASRKEKEVGPSGIARKRYRPTGLGQKVYRHWLTEMTQVHGIPAPAF